MTAKTYRVLVSDPLAEPGLKILSEDHAIQVDVKLKVPPAELVQLIKGYDALVVRSGTQVTREVLEAADRLKVIGRAGAGLDNVDVETASKRGIIVMNAAGGNTIATAEHAFTLLLSMARTIPQACTSLKGGKWERTKYQGVELYRKTLGIVGLGRIGKEVATRAMAFGMQVMAFDPFLAPDRIRELEVEPVALAELLQRSDFITIHTPLTDETRHMIGDKEFALAKKGLRIVNCARGGIIEEAALARAIKAGLVAGAALDVFEHEPPPADHELLHLPQVVVTPHLGASTEEAQLSVAVDIAGAVRDALLGRGIRNAVNVPSVDSELAKILEPYLKLAEAQGSLQAQLAEGHIQEVRVRYVGELVKFDLAALTLAFIKGLLTPSLAETVNYVNAALLARERGIKVIESKSTQSEDFANLVASEVRTDQGSTEVDGCLFTRRDPRIVKINQFYVEAMAHGHAVIIRTLDQPGFIGRVGTILGKHGINIAHMTFGRTKPGGEALNVFNVDSAVPPAVVKELKAAPHVTDVRLVKL